MKRIDEISSFSMGFTPDTKNDSFWVGGNNWLSIAGMDRKYIISGNKSISDQAVEKKRAFPIDTLLMSFKLSIGKLAILRKEMYTNEAICGFVFPQEVMTEFMYYALSHIDVASFGSRAVKGITLNSENIGSIVVPVPPLPEQEKIAEFLSALDDHIDLHSKKIDLLIEQKKGYSQKIFSRELVFKDDNGNSYGEWEKTTLDKVVKIIGGGTPSTSNQAFWTNEISWFTPTEIGKTKYVSFSSRKISSLGLVKSSAKLIPRNSILLTTRAKLGEMAITLEETTTNQGFQNLVPNQDKISTEFLFCLQPMVKTYCETNASGSTFREISKTVLGKMKLSLPSLPEQDKIAKLISALDSQIAAEKEKLELLRQQKQGYMQRIFE